MTVKQLIEKLQSIPDSMKDCEIGVYQYECMFTNITSINGLKVYVSSTRYSEEKMSIEEAEKVDGYKYIVLM